jgi:hypothetical protein
MHDEMKAKLADEEGGNAGKSNCGKSRMPFTLTYVQEL